MTSTPTDRIRLEQQGLGENLNTWGDDKLNQVLRKLDQATKGYISIALTGNYTLTTASYIETTDEAANAVLKLTGSLASGANLTVPSVEYWYIVVNSAGATVTVKTSAGSGVAVPDGAVALVYCDATNVLNGFPTYVGARIQSVSTPTATTDAANKSYVDAGDTAQQAYTDSAIANAGIPASAGTVLISVSDTTARYLGTALQAGTDISLTVTNSGADEQLIVAFTGVDFDTYTEDSLFAAAMALNFA